MFIIVVNFIVLLLLSNSCGCKYYSWSYGSFEYYRID